MPDKKNEVAEAVKVAARIIPVVAAAEYIANTKGVNMLLHGTPEQWKAMGSKISPESG